MIKPAGGICTTCDNYFQCVWHRDISIWDCSEFQLPEVKPQVRPASISVESYTNGSICITCDLISTCQWYKKDAVILQCEHYE